MYFSIGYGWNMDDTNMVIWQSTGTQSTNQCGDYWSRGENNPQKQSVNIYTTSNTVSNGVTTFTTTRPLNPLNPGPKDFAIKLDYDQEMCFAFNPQTS